MSPTDESMWAQRRVHEETEGNASHHHFDIVEELRGVGINARHVMVEIGRPPNGKGWTCTGRQRALIPTSQLERAADVGFIFDAGR